MHQVTSNNKQTHGIALIEVVVGVTMLSLVVLMVLLTLTLFLEARGEILKKTKAIYLAEEGLEVMRYLRDEDWETIATELAPDTVYYLSLSATEVATTTVPETIDGLYTRSFILREVYRNNTSEDIVASTTANSSVDSGSMTVVMRVAFENSTTTLSTMLTNIFDI